MTKKRLFIPGETAPFPLSRSKLGLFQECPRCFWLDRRQGIARPPGFPLALNLAVDALLKREFDSYREKGDPHPFQARTFEGVIPANRPELAEWRNPFKGVRHVHPPSGFEVYGALDDVWAFPDGRLIIVDYKAAATEKPLGLAGEHRLAYRQQLDLYHWTMTGMGLSLAPFSFILWANAKKDRPGLNERLEFEMTVSPYQPSHEWIGPALLSARHCLELDSPPAFNPDCPYCFYRAAARRFDGATDS